MQESHTSAQEPAAKPTIESANGAYIECKPDDRWIPIQEDE